MTDSRYYRVGGHLFELNFPKGLLSEKELHPYAPFQTNPANADDLLFRLAVVEDMEISYSSGELIGNIDEETHRMSVMSHPDGSLDFLLKTSEGSELSRIRIIQGFKEGKLWINKSVGRVGFSLDTALMMIYAFSSAEHETLLIHASVIERGSKGYLFLGKSGTGKSTHSRLWLDNIERSRLLNDDNPIIRIIKDKVYVYGSPWSGKSACYVNHRAIAGGIARLNQASVNSICQLTGIRAYSALLPSCSFMRWDRSMGNDVHTTICKVIEKVPVYFLKCRTDKEAVELSYKALCEGDEGNT